MACLVPTCTGGEKTTLSGVVRDPAGKVPLYNVTVYIPNAALDPIPVGVSCDKCSVKLSGKPIAAALTDANGRFVLENVPATTNVPLVMQVGKWRREVIIPTVRPCVDNPITDVNLTRLPRTKMEGNIPKIALTTGGSDALECLVRKIGIADSEFTTDAGMGRVHLFVGGKPGTTGEGASRFAPTLNGGAAFANATTLWGSPSKLAGYDLLLMACEGSQYADVKMPFWANMKHYADTGGRIFASHLHFNWLQYGPAPWPGTAVYLGGNTVDPASPGISTVDTTFPKGAALADWLVAVGASTTRGQIQLWDAQHSVAATTPPVQRWIYLPVNPNDTAAPKRVANQYMTFNTPFEAPVEAQCGRVVHTDIHVKAAPSAPGESKDDSDPTMPFPTACKAITLSAQEKALEFLFFDLSACVQPDMDRPVVPVVPPPGVPSTPPGVTPVPPPVPPPPPPPPLPPIP
ncbi:MAG: carboxypeptidase regulatory-like domain-containing protein [Deltaproteobacteria bacterium]|nr:carboxypeptidase regulatory-like domain-containing protein [Deltaproteobacteria bacterium]